jgi:bifunctional non-homologous end joining protein LigD
MATIPTTVEFPRALQARKRGRHWHAEVDGVELQLSNLDKLFWEPEGHLKGDLVAYYWNIAPTLLPYLRDRALTLKRMPDGADGEFFYEKQAPAYTPDWMRRVPITTREASSQWGEPKRRTIDYLLADDARALLWLANLGCIEFHPWHSRVDDIGHPDYAFFDLDPMEVPFATVREVALLVRTALDRLGLRSYPRTSGATGIQIYVPIDRVHSAARVRDWVGRVCRLLNRADPERTTMEWAIRDRSGKVFLDHGMNTEGRNIAAAYSLRPERGATVSAPLRWEELEGDVEPGDFTMASIWRRLDEVGDLFTPVLEGGQDLRAAMEAVGMPAESPDDDAQGHDVGPALGGGEESPAARLAAYDAKRRFDRTPEPRGVLEMTSPAGQNQHTPGGAGRFVVQHHLATRLHHDLRFAHEGVAPSWALPKGLPDVPGVRHLAVQTEDHPVEYMTFEGEIPQGEYGGGPVRIWDEGDYDLLEWTDGKVSVRLHGRRHQGEWHLFRIGGQDEPNVWNIIRHDEPAAGELPAAPPALEPMLATLAADPFDDPHWLFEVKWDGVRAIATTVRPGTGGDGSTRLVSRLGNDISEGYPELAALWERVIARNAVIDGEIVAFDERGNPSFQRLQRRMHVRGAQLDRLRRQVPVVYVAFDLLWMDGEPLTDLPLEERLGLLNELIVPGEHLRRSEPIAEHGLALYQAAGQRGLEGVIAKRLGSRYQPGRRSRDWLKLKIRHQLNCVVAGWLPGEGARARLGSLLLGMWDGDQLRYVGKVGTGFDEAELDKLCALMDELGSDERPFAKTAPNPPRASRWIRPELVCTVEFSEVTEGGQLRAPAYKGLVEMDPRDCRYDDLALST